MISLFSSMIFLYFSVENDDVAAMVIIPRFH